MSSHHDVQELVDAMLDAAQRAHPGVEYSVTLPAAEMLRLPKDADQLHRVVHEREGSYRGHVYRDSMVWGIPSLRDGLVVVTPVVGTIPEAADATTFYGDLGTGTFDTTAP